MGTGVFICHATQDAARAQAAVEALERSGTPCWIAPRDIEPGSDYTEAILQALRSAPALVLVFSASANSSPHVRRELETAVSLDLPIVPVRIERTDPTGTVRYCIGTAQYLDTMEVPDDRWQALLVSTVRRVMRREPGDLPTADTATTRHALPVPVGRTFGRDDLCLRVRAALEDGHRLVTLTGPGGVGKTRVALEVAHALARAGHDVQALTRPGSSGPLPPLPVVRSERTFVVVDDLDDAPDAAATVLDALRDEQGVAFLVTSRLPLGAAGEHAMRVDPLPLPPADADRSTIAGAPAVQLLLAAADRRTPGFHLEGREEEAATLCRLLGGLPLAITLAAERLSALGLEQVTEGVRDGLELLRTSSEAVPERQRNLEATIQWSLDRLDDRDLAVCLRAGSFATSFPLPSLQAVCAGVAEPGDVVESLSSLLEIGLVCVVDDPGEPTIRYELPHPIRLVARDGLDSGPDGVQVRETLAGHLLESLEQWAMRLDTADGNQALDAYRKEAADVGAAVDSAVLEGRIETAVALTLAAAPLWLASGEVSAARARARRLLARVSDSSVEQVRLLLVVGRFSYHQNDWDAADAELGQALALGESLGQDESIAAARCYLGATALMTGRVEVGGELARLAFADSERLDLYPLAAEALSVLAISHAIRGEYADERRTHERRLDVARRHGDLARTADALNTLAEIALDEGDPKTARQYATESLRLAGGRLPLESRDATITLARATLAAGSAPEAGVLLEQALGESQRSGQTLALAQCLRVGGCLAVHSGQPDRAVRLFAAAQVLSPSPNGTDDPVEADFVAALSRAREDLGGPATTREWTLGAGLPLETMLTQLQEATAAVSPLAGGSEPT